MRTFTALVGAAAMASVAQAQVDAWFLTLGNDLSSWNSGLMKSFQTNPDDTTTNCYIYTQTANNALVALFDFVNYDEAKYDFFESLDKYSVMQIDLMAAAEECGFKEYMTKIDQMFSSWDTLIGAGTNALVDVILAYTLDTSDARSVNYTGGNGGTPIIKAWTVEIIPAFPANDWANNDWELFGQGFMTFLSALIKFQGADYEATHLQTA